MKRLVKKVAAITGGGKNIGRAISLALAKESVVVYILDINSNYGRKTQKIIKNIGGESVFLKTDVTNTKEINSSFAKIIKKHKRIDILINNAGGSKVIELIDTDEKSFNDNIDINLKSAFFCTKAVLPHMIKKRSGSIIYISSINAILGGFSAVAYSMSKGGIHSLTKSLTADYSKHGIRFNSICLGSIPGDSIAWQEHEKNNPGMLKKLAKMYPIGRFGTPEDVASAVLFLTSEESSWITGINLIVDGGITATGRLPGGQWWNNI
ncbi:SDR family NAD(P)-dependent oxidoreductase [Actinomycetota bacterium]